MPQRFKYSQTQIPGNSLTAGKKTAEMASRQNLYKVNQANLAVYPEISIKFRVQLCQ